MKDFILLTGDALDKLKSLPDNSVDCCVTSPPYYGLRDYGTDKQIGLETSVQEYIDKLVAVFNEVRRVLKKDGTLWLNMGDSYAGSGKGAANYPNNAKQYKQGTNKGMLGASKTIIKQSDEYKRKDLMGIPWRLAFALQADGWYLRQDIIWSKPNCMPESVKDRCTKSHEYIFLLSKSVKYYFDNEAIKEPATSFQDMKRRVKNGYGEWKTKKGSGTYAISGTGRSREELYSKDGKRNKRDVWTISTNAYKGAHFATFPEKLIEPCILAGCKEGGTVIDPFIGSGTTAVVSIRNRRKCIGIELNPKYAAMTVGRVEASAK